MTHLAWFHAYTFRMTMTTIKVSMATRDRLKAQAAAENVSLGEHLTRLADLSDREARFGLLKEAIANTPDHLGASYREETDLWESTELTDLAQS